jgi:hypothetical protein
MEEVSNAYRIFVGKPEGKRRLDLSIDGSIILKWILRKYKWESVNWIYLNQVRGR